MLVRRNSVVPAHTRHPVGFEGLLNDLFDVSFPTVFEGTGRVPAIDTWEDEQSYHVEAEFPGLSEKDIEISVLGNELKLTGSRHDVNEKEEKNWHRRERYTGTYSRVLRFPVDIDTGKVEASFRNGILAVTLPKAEAALPRRIEVKGS